VRGFVGKDDPKLKQIADTPGDLVMRIAPIGGYANPIAVAGGSS
jgi:hypothetical protein